MEIIGNACIITVLGMGFVFIFLGIQVWLTGAMAKFAAKYAYLLPEPEKPQRRPAVKAAVPAPAKPAEGELVAVIAAAIQAHNAK
jgi:sodium pump decarboxylase gamma subunit